MNELPKITRKAGKSIVLTTRVFLLIYLSVFTLQGFSQISYDSQEELEKAANDFFEASDYSSAKPLFSQLLSKDALDPNYNYRFGVCVLFTEADPMKPLPYIEGGANSAGVNAEAHYFLGKAYQLNYRFDEAIKSYEKGKKAGLSKEGMDLDRSIKECRNGKILYNGSIGFKPAMDKEVFANEFYRPYDFRKLKGKVIPMPPSFKTKYDEKNLKGAVVYTPTNSQTLVYSSYGEDGANGKDLYRVNRLPNGELALPLRLPNTINTKYDEDYAFYDEESQILYFASTGHNTMGGYDVFSSKYDLNTNTWSTPVNLQFPINSPYDDFLYVSDPDGKLAFFTSGRSTPEGKLRVLKTLLHDPQQVEVSIVEGTFTDQTDSVYNYAALTVLDPITNEVVGKYRSHKQTGKYLLVLPPQNDYKMDVGPKEANGFKFDLDVPKSDSYHPLKQEVDYSEDGTSGTVTVSNFFDPNGSSEPVIAEASRPISELEEQMVAMPEMPAAVVSRDENREEEELALKEAEAAAALEKKKQEEAEKALALAQKAKEDSVRQAKIAEEQLAAKLEKARQDSIQKAEELAASVKAEKEKAEKALAAEQEKERLDSIRQVEEQVLALEKELRQQKLKNESEAKEKARLDSIAEVDLALLEAAGQAVDAEEIERQFLADAREKAKQDSIRQVEEFERLRAAHLAAQARRDSVSRALELAEAQKRKEKVARDSIAAVELAIEQEKEKKLQLLKEQQALAAEIQSAKTKAALAILEAERQLAEKGNEEQERDDTIDSEQERLAQIEREVELVKQQALRDSLEIIDTEEVEIAVAESEEREPQQSMEEKKEITAASTESQPATQLEETEVLSESQLFLETIAKLEAQKKEQEALVEEENRNTLEAKNEERKAPDAITETDEEELAGKSESIEGEDLVETDSEELANEEIVSETQTQLLKSHADPNAYLSQLNEIERKIAEEEEAKPDKSYTLNTIEARAAEKGDETLDPVLQAKIEADRKALAEHRKMAEEKERALREQMARDKSEVSELDIVLDEELVSAEPTNEQVVVVDIEAKKKLSQTEAETEKDAAEIQTEINIAEEATEAVTAVKDENTPEPKVAAENAEQVQEEKVETDEASAEVDDEVLAAMKEFDAILDGNEETSSEVITETEAETQEEIVVNEVENTEKEAVPSNESSGAKDEPKAAAETRPEPVTNGVETVGQIPFLTAALRDYSARKPSFESIEDKSMRRMVKRMRSEDIGRMAVLKNMKNQWVESGRSTTALSEIKENKRNQDVLATVVSREPSAREEVVRPPFNRDDLKRRQNVYYKLELAVRTADVSPTIKEAMTPEQAMTFAMPEFKLQFDRFATLADARTVYNEYKGRGFDKVKIVPFINNEPSTLSVVSSIPFVD